MVVLIRLIAAATLLSGCFSPSLDGKFHCGDGGACPPGLSCASDGVCRDEDGGTALAHDLSTTGDLATREDLAAACVKKTCGLTECGNALDGCGGMLMCTVHCVGAMKCGGSGANQCGATDCKPASCGQQGATCGLVSDGCASVMNCGNCKNGQACGTDNACH